MGSVKSSALPGAILQLKVRLLGISPMIWRRVLVATGMGLKRHGEDFSQTLAVWRVKEGAYLDLPVFGPNSVRDVTNVPIAWQTSGVALADASGLAVPALVNTRANASGMIEFRDRVALDSYVVAREAYRRRRNHLIMDGEVPEDEDDFYSFAPSRRVKRQEY